MSEAHPFCTRSWWYHLTRRRCRECELEKLMQDTWQSLAEQLEDRIHALPTRCATHSVLECAVCLQATRSAIASQHNMYVQQLTQNPLAISGYSAALGQAELNQLANYGLWMRSRR